MSIVPVNYRKQDHGAEAIARDVDYALSIAESYVQRVPGGAAGLVGRRVLELGPGYSLGTAVLLACHGAHVTAADRYLAPWDADYHSVFMRALLARLSGARRELSPAPLLALLAAGDFVPLALTPLHVGVEDLDGVLSASFDIVVSNAVFEHVEDVPRALQSLARITRRGGTGIHQVDFRDHRDFSRPLEYLTLAEAEFRREFTHCRGECGNRWRHVGMGRAMAAAGFQVLDFAANMFAEEAYLDGLRPRLHPEQCGLEEEALRVISGCFVLRRGVAASPSEGFGNTPAHERARRAFAARFAPGRRVLDVRPDLARLACFAREEPAHAAHGAATGAPLAAGLAVAPGTAQGEAHAAAQELLAAGAEEVAAVPLDAAGTLDRPDGSADLVTCLHALPPAGEGAAFVREMRRVLAPDGIALVSVPLGGGASSGDGPSGSPAAELAALVSLLADFEWVEFFVQAETLATAVLPLEGGPARRVVGSLEMPGAAALAEPPASSLLALCRRSRPVSSDEPAPVAVACGPAPLPASDTQTAAAARKAAAEDAALAAALSASLHDEFLAANKLRWSALDAGLKLPTR